MPTNQALFLQIATLCSASAELAQQGLTGRASQAALTVLAQSWRNRLSPETDAQQGAPAGAQPVTPETMRRELEAVIDDLECFVMRLTDRPGAERLMRTNLGLAADLADFDSLEDAGMDWVALVRQSYPDVGPKEAARLARDEYVRCEGILPQGVSTE